MSRTTILDRHEHVKINGFAHVSHIDGTYTHALLDCLYFPDQERRYEFVISSCVDVSMVLWCGRWWCPLWTLIFHKNGVPTLARVALGVSYGGAALPGSCLMQIDASKPAFRHPCGPLVHPNGARQLLHFSSGRCKIQT